ncbi:MAG TPA: hypothetical protein VGJ08_04580 [Rhizomicrobium sp.]|jgi:hypothetical protein
MKKLSVVFCAPFFVASGALAALPAQLGAFGFNLHTTPAVAMSTFERDYAACSPTRSIYHERPGDKAPITAGLSVNPGMMYNDIGAPYVCSFSTAGEGITDTIEAKFAHPDIDADQPMYSLEVQRLYPDVVYGHPARLRNTFEVLRAQLMRTYGKPIDERREKVMSSAANLAWSLGIGNDVKREDYLVRYLWAAKGRLVEEETEQSTCRCDGPYVKAVIEISRSPLTIPKNTFYVLSVTLLVEDQTLRARQDAWNSQWQQRTK